MLQLQIKLPDYISAVWLKGLIAYCKNISMNNLNVDNNILKINCNFTEYLEIVRFTEPKSWELKYEIR